MIGQMAARGFVDSPLTTGRSVNLPICTRQGTRFRTAQVEEGSCAQRFVVGTFVEQIVPAGTWPRFRGCFKGVACALASSIFRDLHFDNVGRKARCQCIRWRETLCSPTNPWSAWRHMLLGSSILGPSCAHGAGIGLCTQAGIPNRALAWGCAFGSKHGDPGYLVV